MESSGDPVRISLEVAVWWNDDGTIGLIVPDLQGSRVDISDNPRRAHGHPKLHHVLAHCLRSAVVDMPASGKDAAPDDS